jgi:hypothetical protein
MFVLTDLIQRSLSCVAKRRVDPCLFRGSRLLGTERLCPEVAIPVRKRRVLAKIFETASQEGVKEELGNLAKTSARPDFDDHVGRDIWVTIGGTEE